MATYFHRQTHRLWLGAALLTLAGSGVMSEAWARDYLTGEPGIGAVGLDEPAGSILAPEREAEGPGERAVERRPGRHLVG